MGLDLGSIVGKVVEWTAPPGVREAADIAGIDIEEEVAGSFDAGVDAARRYIESPLTPYGQAKRLADFVQEHPKSIEQAVKGATQIGLLSMIPGLGAVAHVVSAAREHPREAAVVADAVGWLSNPVFMATKQAAEQLSRNPKAALAVHDQVMGAIPGASLLVDARRFLLGF